MIKVGIHGSTGRMGAMLIENLSNNPQASISALHAIDKFNFNVDKDLFITHDTNELLNKSEVVIDFTIAKGTENLLEMALENPKPLVIGTTGLNANQQKLLQKASCKMPILYSSNMSLGVAVLNKLVFLASKALDEFDCEIVEFHHRFKKDSPSGTALSLGKSAADARNLNLDDVRISGRDGLVGEREKNKIAIMSLRGGDIVGRHTVGFYNDGEFIELNHTATHRSTFAKGAIKAAIWLINQKNGLYNINDCLNLS